MTIPAYPLKWPEGWKRTSSTDRTNARFGKASRPRAGGGWDYGRSLTISEGVDRVRAELSRMKVHDDDLVINSNLELRLDGFPRSGQREPDDPGVAVYWRAGNDTRCMAIDRYDRVADNLAAIAATLEAMRAIERYDRVADNLAAIAATLEAMRAIERHGGASILDRAFTGFTAIEDQSKPWHVVLGVPAYEATDDVRTAYRRGRAKFHPDRPGGDSETFQAIQQAWDAFCRERGVDA